jgi:hypothetical protein
VFAFALLLSPYIVIGAACMHRLPLCQVRACPFARVGRSFSIKGLLFVVVACFGCLAIAGLGVVAGKAKATRSP